MALQTLIIIALSSLRQLAALYPTAGENIQLCICWLHISNHLVKFIPNKYYGFEVR